jgi:hypothetical protein
MSTESFNFNTFLKDSVNTLVKPKEYFSSMKVEGGLGEPVIKALIYGAISGVFTLLWSIFKLGAVTGSMFGGAVGIMAFFWAIIGAVIGLFIGAVITLILSAICGGSTDYTANARVTASLMVLMPVSAFFGFLSGFNFYLGFIIKLIINLYSLYMLYWALSLTLKGKEKSSKILTIVLAAILALFLLIGLGTRKAANKFLDDFGIETENMEKSFKDLAKDMEDAMEEAKKELEEEIEDSQE